MKLYHTFDNRSKFTFEQSENTGNNPKTDNVMDYYNVPRSTAQWQWDRVQQVLNTTKKEVS